MHRRIALFAILIPFAAAVGADDRAGQLAAFAGKWKTSKIDEIAISVAGDKLRMTIRGIEHPRLADVAADGTVSWMGQTGTLNGDELKWSNGDVWARQKD